MRPTNRIVAAVLALLLPGIAAPTAPADAATVEPFALASATNGIALGPDGNLWVAEQYVGTVALMSPVGAPITHFPVGNGPTTVTAGPGGRVWVAVTEANKLTWFDATSASPTAHDVPTPSGCNPIALVSGGNGRMYFSCSGATKLGSVKDDGTDLVAEDVGAGQVFDLAVSGGKLFAPDFGGDVVRRLTLASSPSVDSIVSMPSPAANTSPATPKRTACPRRSPIARLGVSIGALPEPSGASQVRCAPV